MCSHEVYKLIILLIYMGNLCNRKIVQIPELNEELAEFIGILLGDGTLTKYFIRITGDHRYDLHYFNYIKSIVKNLFDVNVDIRREKGRNNLVLTISSVEICKYLNEIYKIPYGDKLRNNSKIPKQIMKDEKLFLACLRGLVDTDGCIGKSGNFFRIVFSSRNKNYLEQVWKIGTIHNFFGYLDHEQISTGAKAKVKKYFKLVGSSNLRHIIRFREWEENNKLLYVNETLNFYNKYAKIKLPWAHGAVGSAPP